MAKSQASSESYVSTTTNTITDSYNQAYNSVSNLSNVGNVSIAGEGVGGSLSSGVMLILVGGAVAVFYIFKKGKS